MASSGRPWRGGGGGGGGRRRGGPQRGGYRRRGSRDRDMPPPPSSEDLASEEINAEGKKITIELKKNDQGQFFKVLESDDQQQHRGKVIFSSDTAHTFRPILNELIEKYKEQGPPDENSASERIHTMDFNQGKRKFFADLRQNQRGYFMKLTQVSKFQRVFVAVPGESLTKFQEVFENILDTHVVPCTDTSPPMSPVGPPLPASQEVRAGGKSFFFDVARNDMGVYVRLTEVLRNSGRRTHINIPNSCWSKIADVLMNFHQEMPTTESASVSGSEDN